METILEKYEIISAGDAKKILESDNSEIKDLCKQHKIYPKRDKHTGKAFFLKEDVEFLKKMKELHAQSQPQELTTNSYAVSPIQADNNNNNNTTLLVVNEFKGLIEKMMSNQDKLIDRMQSTLDSKLEGLDEVVLELIQAKTENENLRLKLNQMTKENYELKNSLETFKPIGFGFYVK